MDPIAVSTVTMTADSSLSDPLQEGTKGESPSALRRLIFLIAMGLFITTSGSRAPSVACHLHCC